MNTCSDYLHNGAQITKTNIICIRINSIYCYLYLFQKASVVLCLAIKPL